MNKFNRVLSLKFVLLFSISFLCSCSSLNFFDREETVSKKKYEDLLKKYKSLVSNNTPKQPSLTAMNVDDSGALKDFRAQLIAVKGSKNVKSKSYNLRRVQKDIGLLYQAYEKYRNKKYGDVIIILKELENSQVQKVRAQSRYLLGITMLEQGELDLSMQIFEEIVLKMRNSVFALLSLEHLIITTKKMGLMKKNEYFTKLYARFLK